MPLGGYGRWSRSLRVSRRRHRCRRASRESSSTRPPRSPARRSPTNSCAAGRSASSIRTMRTTRSSPTSSWADADGKVRYEASFASPSRSIRATPAASCGTTYRIAPARSRSLRPSAPRRHRTRERMAGRQRGRDGDTRQPRHGTNHWVAVPMAKTRTVARHGQRAGTHRQPHRRRFAAAERHGQSRSVPARHARHHAGDADHAHARDRIRADHRRHRRFRRPTGRSHIATRRLRSRARPTTSNGRAAGQPAGAHLPEERLRSDLLYQLLPGEGRVSARRRHGRVP